MHADLPWYASAFDADYPILQTFEEAWTVVQAASVETLLELPQRARILDLACGYGRHSRLWCESGHAAFGLDLSAPLLRLARQAEPRGRWIRGDVRRLPFAPETFDAAVFMFISFGYFEESQEDLAALREAHTVLRPGGGIFLELKHPAYLRDHPPPDDTISIGEAQVAEMSRIVPGPEGERYQIRRELRLPARPPRRYLYSIRLYGPGEIQSLLEEAGFANVRLFGDYDGSPASPSRQRLIATARKPPRTRVSGRFSPGGGSTRPGRGPWGRCGSSG